MPADNNSIPHLLALTLRVQACEEERQKDVRVDLRINCSEIEGPEDCVVSVRLRKVTLRLNLAGLDAVPNTLLGEPVREIKVVGKQTNTTRTTLDAKPAGLWASYGAVLFSEWKDCFGQIKVRGRPSKLRRLCLMRRKAPSFAPIFSRLCELQAKTESSTRRSSSIPSRDSRTNLPL